MFSDCFNRFRGSTSADTDFRLPSERESDLPDARSAQTQSRVNC
jgi:hypothetical protein